jgi:5-methylcytosine-specific restriction endonuclease McrA
VSGEKRSYAPDPRPEKRIKDPAVMKALHVRGVVCALCGNPGTLDHIYPKGQGGDDVPSNLMGLCGGGTSGCHGLKHSEDVYTRIQIGEHLVEDRPDFMFYIQGKLGETEGREWLRKRFFIHV